MGYFKENGLILYLQLQVIMAVALFISGFFPVKPFSRKVSSFDDLPTTIGKLSVDPSELYKPRIDKFILMVIDGLRYDFITEKYIINMPYLQNRLTKGDSCLLKTKVDAPTVTMPRIKALMTGNTPGFVDVILNFHSNEVLQDNLILQTLKKGFVSVFYGDETWLKLFPNAFTRSEPTKSFFVSDFTEVDDNVTRNIDKELSRTDWDIMILHYLGLDHIGHVYGSQELHIAPKLKEMDSIIAKIDRFILRIKEKSKRAVLLICSDHGMRDAGGHGGSSDPEIYVPHIFLDHGCENNSSNLKLNQIDMTPLIAILLGLPIPSGNSGKLNYKLLTFMDPNAILYAMHYNTVQMRDLFQQYHIQDVNSISDNVFEKAENIFESCIEGNFTDTNYIKAMELYYETQNFMSNEINKQNLNFDFISIVCALILLIQVIYHIFSESVFIFNTQRSLLTVVIVLFVVYINSEVRNLMYGRSFVFSQVGILCWACLTLNMINLKPRNFNIKCSGSDVVPIIFMLLHLFSYASTSYIEYEHQFWFYTFGSFLIFTSSRVSYWLSLLLPLHFVFSKINMIVTNDNATLDSSEGPIYWLLSTYFVASVVVIIWCFLNLNINKKRSIINFISYLLIFEVIVYFIFLNIKSGRLFYPLKIKNSFIGDIDLRVSSGTGILFFMCYHYILALSKPGYQSKRLMMNVIDTAVLFTVSLILFVNKLVNAAIIPYILICSNIIKTLCGKNILKLTSCHLILGMVCFFYQGNTNNLATIDVASGIIGLNEPNMALAGFLIVLNTFGAHILSTLLLFKTVYSNYRDTTADNKCFKLITLLSSLYMLTYGTLIIFQRHHLFIWSVFSPKLLYLGSLIFIYCVLIILIICLDFINYILLNYVICLFVGPRPRLGSKALPI